jgi:energy-coupling factor transport system substrate-specific component
MGSKTKRIALISILTATAVASRVVLAPLPNIKPVGFLSLLSGVIGGPVIGFLVGLLTMVVTDILFFGAGPWTFVTSFSMGIIGLLGSVFAMFNKTPSRYNLFVFTYFSILFYDLFTSITMSYIFGTPVITSIIMLFLPLPIPFGPAHEITNALLASFLVPEVCSRIGRDVF